MSVQTVIAVIMVLLVFSTFFAYWLTKGDARLKLDAAFSVLQRGISLSSAVLLVIFYVALTDLASCMDEATRVDDTRNSLELQIQANSNEDWSRAAADIYRQNPRPMCSSKSFYGK